MPFGCSWILPPPTPPHYLPSTLCFPSSAPSNKRNKTTEGYSMGVGPIRGRNTPHRRLLLDQPNRVVPGIVSQLSCRSLLLCQMRRKKHCLLAACKEDCYLLFYWTWITRDHNGRGFFFLLNSHQFCKWMAFDRGYYQCWGITNRRCFQKQDNHTSWLNIVWLFRLAAGKFGDLHQPISVP